MLTTTRARRHIFCSRTPPTENQSPFRLLVHIIYQYLADHNLYSTIARYSSPSFSTETRFGQSLALPIPPRPSSHTFRFTPFLEGIYIHLDNWKIKFWSRSRSKRNTPPLDGNTEHSWVQKHTGNHVDSFSGSLCLSGSPSLRPCNRHLENQWCVELQQWVVSDQSQQTRHFFRSFDEQYQFRCFRYQ